MKRVTKVRTDPPDPRVSPVPQAYQDWQVNPAMGTALKVNVARRERRVCVAGEEALAQLDRLGLLENLDPWVILDTRDVLDRLGPREIWAPRVPKVMQVDVKGQRVTRAIEVAMDGMVCRDLLAYLQQLVAAMAIAVECNTYQCLVLQDHLDHLAYQAYRSLDQKEKQAWKCVVVSLETLPTTVAQNHLARRRTRISMRSP